MLAVKEFLTCNVKAMRGDRPLPKQYSRTTSRDYLQRSRSSLLRSANIEYYQSSAQEVSNLESRQESVQEIVQEEMTDLELGERRASAHVTFNLNDISEKQLDGLAEDDASSTKPECRVALMTAASFRMSEFGAAVLAHGLAVLDANNDGPRYTMDPAVVEENIRIMDEVLAILAEDGLVEETSLGQYKFKEDNVRQAAASLLPREDERKEVHLKIGRQLRSWLEMQTELGIACTQDSLLLCAVDQLNLGAELMEDEWEKVDLAELNMQAAEVLLKNLLFGEALQQLDMAVALIGVDCEMDHYYMVKQLEAGLLKLKETVDDVKLNKLLARVELLKP